MHVKKTKILKFKQSGRKSVYWTLWYGETGLNKCGGWVVTSWQGRHHSGETNSLCSVEIKTPQIWDRMLQNLSCENKLIWIWKEWAHLSKGNVVWVSGIKSGETGALCRHKRILDEMALRSSWDKPSKRFNIRDYIHSRRQLSTSPKTITTIVVITITLKLMWYSKSGIESRCRSSRQCCCTSCQDPLGL